MMKEENSRRGFFKKAAATAGVVAAAGYAIKSMVPASPAPAGGASGVYAGEDAQQKSIMAQKQFVVMTDSEKKQMLEEILDSHYKNLA